MSTPDARFQRSPGPSSHPPLSGTSTVQQLQVSIREASEAQEDGWPIAHTVYHVVTSSGGQSFEVQRRFREFVVLHQRLRAYVDGLPTRFPLWGNLLNRFDAGVVEARKVGLARYLTDVLDLLQGAALPQPLRAFLELPTPEDAEPEQPMMMQAVLEPTDTVILVAYQLPLDISRKAEGGYDIRWNVDAVLNKASLQLPMRVLWVGCVSLRVPKEEREALADELLEQYDCVPVFLEEKLQADFYHGFCRGFLRPIFHNMRRCPRADGASPPAGPPPPRLRAARPHPPARRGGPRSSGRSDAAPPSVAPAAREHAAASGARLPRRPHRAQTRPSLTPLRRAGSGCACPTTPTRFRTKSGARTRTPTAPSHRR